MLILLRNAEVGEDHHDDEDVVDAERLLDDVAGEEGQRGLGVLPDVQPESEDERERHPDAGPDRSFLRANDVRPAMEDAEVEREHPEHERVEQDPEPDICRHESSRKRWADSRKARPYGTRVT
jgi:hypothetical protein